MTPTHLEVLKAKETLKNAGYFVDNLWSIEDVKDRFECTEEQAQDVLYFGLTNEYVVEQIQFSIKDYATDKGYKQITQ
jgi:hypothetical protein